MVARYCLYCFLNTAVNGVDEFAPSAAEGRGDCPDYGYLQYDAKTYEGWSKDGREALIRALDAEFNPPGQPVLADVLRMLMSHSHNNQPMAVTHPYHSADEPALSAGVRADDGDGADLGAAR